MRQLPTMFALLFAFAALGGEPVKIVLQTTAGREAGKKLAVHSGDIFQVGRSARSDLKLDDGKVSRNHLKVSCDAKHCQVEDLDSTNGTLLNGKRVKTSDVKVGDKLMLGETLLVVSAP